MVHSALLSPGINSTTTVSGGDGAFCHIDQNEPNIQISSYIYNDYYITNDSWANSNNVVIGVNAGEFINPTDYDSDNNILYGCFTPGSYSYISDVGAANNTGSRAIPAFGGATITTVRLSPNVINRVYFGLDNGSVVRVENAHDATAAGVVVRMGAGSVSCITLEAGNEDHILVTYSNYGANSVWETIDGGANWTSIEGNLPDMPVRWIEFAPGNNDQALVATEMGVWSTDDLDGMTTDWGQPVKAWQARVWTCSYGVLRTRK
ncbi:MAG: hypothetical protein R3B47_03390 [Bacteroidia bacterium]